MPSPPTPTVHPAGLSRAPSDLATPGPMTRYLPRPRLVTQLDALVRAPVTLVSAPAGWGKTVLLSAWARAHSATARLLWFTAGRHSALASGRPNGTVDGGPGLWRRILTGLARLGAIRPDQIDDAPGDPQRVADAVESMPEPLIVVVDDFDGVAGQDVIDGVEYLVRALGDRLRLVLACRCDPPLPLHRWRVSGELGELRADQLAFTMAETGDLLTAYGVPLTESAVAELHAVSEGWSAGLRLAAVAMHAHPEPEQVLDNLGVHDVVADYLAAEVLSPLPAEVGRLLMDVSVVERVTSGLIEALTGRQDGARLLASMRQCGTFVRRVAGPGDWYRIHPLLSRLLYTQLQHQDPYRVVEAHRRAAGWYITHGPPADALRHLLAGEDWDTAVDVIDRHWPDIVAGGRWRSLHDVVAPPPHAIHTEPRLALAFAAERLDAGDPARARYFLRIADGFDGPDSGSRRPPAPMMRAFWLAEARLDGDLPRVLDVAPKLLSGSAPASAGADQPRQTRALGLIAMGTAKLQLGELSEAGSPLRDGLSLASQTDLAQAQVSAGSQLAMWYATRGRLRAAARTGRDTLALAERQGLSHLSDLGWVRLALAEAFYQWDRLDEARQLIDEALDHAHRNPQMLISATILLAKVRSAAGQLDRAYEVLRTARQEAATALVSRSTRRALSLVEAELRLAGGDLAAARRRLANWPYDEPLPAWAATVEAAILLAEGRAAAAAAAVAPLLAEPGTVASLTWTVQAGLLSALAGQVLGDRDRVTRGLDVAFEAAEAEGFRRTFVAGGHAVRELIDTVAPAMAAYSPVIAELAKPPDPGAPVLQPAMPPRSGPAGKPLMGGVLAEPLTERELTVLRYLQGTLSNLEIAGLLYVSVNTVKTHVRSIYRKLDVGHRREAVRRARELRLL